MLKESGHRDHFVRWVRVYDTRVNVAGSSPKVGILAQMCECVMHCA